MSSGCYNNGETNDFDAYMFVIEEVKNELLQEEFESIQEYESRGLQADIDHFQNISNRQSGVLCPVCCKGYFTCQLNILTCSCGIKLRPEKPGATLADLQVRLEAIFNLHMVSSCSKRLDACTMLATTDSQYHNIAFTCNFCDFFDLLM